jgi:hypothetical protein
MKILKKSGNYLKRRALLNLSRAILCLLFFAVVLYSNVPNSYLYVDAGRYELARILILIVALLFGYHFFGQYSGYKRGYEGENRVARVLSSSLSDEYHLLNDVPVPNGYGNIDHIVIGPNGVFVIETKNYAGHLICNGDTWSRSQANKRYGRLNSAVNFDLGSPSKQAKRNATKIKDFIESIDQFRRNHIWVEAILVFSNPRVDLEISNPTVPILKTHELPFFISSRKFERRFSSSEINIIGKRILMQQK